MSHNQNQTSKLVGLLAEFDDPDSLVQACDQARQYGYKVMDAYSPFPVHGIDPAIGIRRTKLPFIVLSVALCAVCLGLGMQWYTNKYDASPIFPGYAFKISGKPYFSLPANIPVTFEVIVLSSAFATFFGMWLLNQLPRLSNPLHRMERFKRATNDKFFLLIETGDAKFDRSRTASQLQQWGAVVVEECRQDLTDIKLPSWLKLGGVLLAVLLLLPPVMIYRAMGMTNRHPRLHFMPDMDWQHKFKAQRMSPAMAEGSYLFADLRSARAPVAGSVAWGHLDTDGEMYRGIKKDWKPKVTATANVGPSVSTSTSSQDAVAASQEPAEKVTPPPVVEEDLTKYVTEFPEGVEVNAELLARGQRRFEIYCSVCHGYAGNGDGLVNARAVALNATGQATWTTAKSLHDPIVKDAEKNPLGRIFETISLGRNTMGPYKDQIPVADRWAIVAYVKSLQETGIKPLMVVDPAATDAPAVDAAPGQTGD